MESILPTLLIVAMGLTALVLVVGVATFAFSTSANRKYGNKLMTARVILQGVALALFALMALLQIV